MANCIVCGEKLSELAVFHNMPASAQDFPRKEDLEREKPVDLPLCQCLHCGLVQFDTEPVPYYKDVIRAGGGTTTMRRLREEEYKKLLSYLQNKGQKEPVILELGSGQGEFLKMWEGVECGALTPYIFGIEHKKSLVEKGRAAGLPLYEGFPEEDFSLKGLIALSPDGKQEKEVGEEVDAMVQFNFLEHQKDPKGMLDYAYTHLRPGGIFLLTVPSFHYILDNKSYYELLRDHISNFTEESLQYLSQEAGFSLIESRVINRDTIEFVLQKEAKENLSIFRYSGQKIDISPLLENEKEIQEDVEAHIAKLKEEGEKMAIWGASHQGLTLLSTTALKDVVSYIIDSAPFKQGLYSPASHVLIVPPKHFQEEPVDEILIVAPGYTDEIAGIIKRDFQPFPRILALRGERITEL
ncbi:MAG: methyltransferase domain-containing protein [Oribacterium parvum]|uniref:class I SAM-dependent methyltransferase n=1 Tax=Oribacterium parvum TaxID=1501329 RepID=UPI001CB472AC|nr:class I SAM-dependent methyltransferase [Oribacterium parvum]MBF1269689.1 methyltransferase domain-containing protein [Oribacterium parvum]